MSILAETPKNLLTQPPVFAKFSLVNQKNTRKLIPTILPFKICTVADEETDSFAFLVGNNASVPVDCLTWTRAFSDIADRQRFVLRLQF